MPHSRCEDAVADLPRPADRYKRSFDLAVLLVAGALLAPVWIPLCGLIALSIRLEDGGPVLHRQRRVGHHGREFEILKFRTMVEGAERVTGPVLASRRDRRTTRVGAALRRCHLDELPQAVNVLRGEMSLVGPRPERPSLTRRIIRQMPAFGHRLCVLPGLAGLAQARGDYHTTPVNKFRFDRLYIANMSPWLDIKLLAACVWKALCGRPVRQRRRRPGRPDAPRSRTAPEPRDVAA